MKEKYTVGSPMPRSVGMCADLYAEVRELRLAMQKATNEMQARETELHEHMIRTLKASDDTGAAGKRYRAQVYTKVLPIVESADWPVLWAFIRKNNRFDLLHKRINDKAIQDMWEDGETVPGVSRFRAKKLSITKI